MSSPIKAITADVLEQLETAIAEMPPDHRTRFHVAQTVLWYLASWARWDEATNTYVVDSSVGQIAAGVRTPEGLVRRALAALTTAGLVVVITPGGGRGRRGLGSLRLLSFVPTSDVDDRLDDPLGARSAARPMRSTAPDPSSARSAARSNLDRARGNGDRARGSTPLSARSAARLCSSPVVPLPAEPPITIDELAEAMAEREVQLKIERGGIVKSRHGLVSSIAADHLSTQRPRLQALVDEQNTHGWPLDVIANAALGSPQELVRLQHDALEQERQMRVTEPPCSVCEGPPAYFVYDPSDPSSRRPLGNCSRCTPNHPSAIAGELYDRLAADVEPAGYRSAVGT